MYQINLSLLIADDANMSYLSRNIHSIQTTVNNEQNKINNSIETNYLLIILRKHMFFNKSKTIKRYSLCLDIY